MEEKRRFKRHQVRLKAQYYLKEKDKHWEECTIIDVSRKGMGIIFLTGERIEVGSTVLFEIPLLAKLEPIYILGVLKWVEQRDRAFMGGIESVDLLSDLKLYYSPLEE